MDDRVTIARPPKGRPTAEMSQRKAEGILTVAREQFCKLGYRAVTMRGIAEKASVSTRTLYNQYADKLSLFTACLDFGAAAFPVLDADSDGDVATSLRAYAIALVEMLSTDTSRQLGMLAWREGAEFPELAQAAEDNQSRYLVTPLAHYLQGKGLAPGDGTEHASLLISMILSNWQRRVSFRRPLPSPAEVANHVDIVLRLFLGGAAAATQAGA